MGEAMKRRIANLYRDYQLEKENGEKIEFKRCILEEITSEDYERIPEKDRNEFYLYDYPPEYKKEFSDWISSLSISELKEACKHWSELPRIRSKHHRIPLDYVQIDLIRNEIEKRKIKELEKDVELLKHNKIDNTEIREKNKITTKWNQIDKEKQEELSPKIVAAVRDEYDKGGRNKEQTFNEISKKSKRLFGYNFSPGTLGHVFYNLGKQKLKNEYPI